MLVHIPRAVDLALAGKFIEMDLDPANSAPARIDHATAKALLTAALALDSHLGTLDTIISTIPDEALLTRYATALGNLIGNINADFIAPLVAEYPDLDPDPPP